MSQCGNKDIVKMYVLQPGTSGSGGLPGTSGTSGTSGVCNPGATYSEVVDFVENITVTINHNLGTTNVLVQIIDLNTNELIYGLVDNYQLNSIDVTLTQTLNNINIVIAGGSFVDCGTSGGGGVDGTSGTSGTSGSNGTSGTSGTSGNSGTSGGSGTSGSSGTSGTSGSSGVDGTSGVSGSSGTSGVTPIVDGLYLPLSGGTITGDLFVSGSLTATTYYGDGSNLTGVVGEDNYISGATYNPITSQLEFFGTNSATTFNVSLSAITVTSGDTYVTGGTYVNNVLTLSRNDGQDVIVTGFTTNGSGSTIIFQSTPPSQSFSGNTWVRTTDYEPFFFDVNRNKWLSSNTNSFDGIRNRLNQSSVFLRTIDGTPYNLAPYITTKDCTITTVVGQTTSSDTFKILISTGTTLPTDVIYELSLVSQLEKTDDTVNVDVPKDTKLYLYMSGTTINYPKTMIYYKYR